MSSAMSCASGSSDFTAAEEVEAEPAGVDVRADVDAVFPVANSAEGLNLAVLTMVQLLYR